MEPGIEDKVAYLIAVISEFAAKHTLTTPQAYRYLECLILIQVDTCLILIQVDTFISNNKMCFDYGKEEASSKNK